MIQDLQKSINNETNKIHFAYIYYVELTYIYEDNSENISNMDLFYSSYEAAKESYEFFIKNSVKPEGLKDIKYEIKSSIIEIIK